MEDFGIVAYRSRTQVLQLEAALQRAGVGCSVINTPREVALGCGLSIRFELRDLDRVRGVVRQMRHSGLIGIYRVNTSGEGRRLTALNRWGNGGCSPG